MEKKTEQLDPTKATEQGEHDGKTLDEETTGKLAGGNYGAPSRCPQCGEWNMEITAELIQGGPDAGRLEVHLFCPSCGYTDWWDW